MNLSKQKLNRLKYILQCGHDDCEMALCDDWDRSDSGFEALRDNLTEAAELLGIELKEYVSEKEICIRP